MRRKLLLLQLCFFVLGGGILPAHAQEPPVPERKTKALNTYKNRLAQETEQKKELEQKVKKIQTRLSDTKDKMVSIASAIQDNERELKEYEKRIVNLEIRKSILEDKLSADKASIAKLILALERIRRTPPEAMLARPDSPYKTAQSAMLMGDILPAIHRHADKVKKNLDTLTVVSNDLMAEKKALEEKSLDLKQRHDALKGLIDQRQNLYSKTTNDLKARELSIQKISLQAKNLEELVQKIKEDERKERQRKKTAFLIRPKAVPDYAEDNSVHMPISGIIRTSYNQKDQLGAKSKGISIEGRGGGLVVAPMGGKIQFTGAFKRYGNIVIIEHNDGYHSLVAGLDQIHSSVGDIVKSGEPIGILPDSSLIPRPTLYYELRRNGKPVDPSTKFADLG